MQLFICQQGHVTQTEEEMATECPVCKGCPYTPGLFDARRCFWEKVFLCLLTVESYRFGFNKKRMADDADDCVKEWEQRFGESELPTEKK